jgi:hypothetical protein
MKIVVGNLISLLGISFVCWASHFFVGCLISLLGVSFVCWENLSWLLDDWFSIRAISHLSLIPCVRSIDNKPFSVTFDLLTYLLISDISEVRVEGSRNPTIFSIVGEASGL